jgi:hypothetical protein
VAKSAAITSSSKTLTVATYIATNTFAVNEAVIVFGLVTNSALNFSTPRLVTAASGSQFSVGGFASGTVGSVSESGTGIDPYSWLGEGDVSSDYMDANGIYVGTISRNHQWLGQGDISFDWMDSNGIYTTITAIPDRVANTKAFAYFDITTNQQWNPQILSLLDSGNVLIICLSTFMRVFGNLIGSPGRHKVR